MKRMATMKNTQRQKKICAKNLILLIVSFMLVVVVCLAASFAWFSTSKTAYGNASLSVMKFSFLTNGSDDENVTLTPSSTDPVYPGSTFTIPVTFKNNGNAGSYTNAEFSVTVEAIDAPKNITWKFKIGDAAYTDVTGQFFKNDAYYTGGTLINNRALNTGATLQCYLQGTWHYSSENNKYDADDTQFQLNKNAISVKLKVKAHQKQ